MGIYGSEPQFNKDRGTPLPCKPDKRIITVVDGLEMHANLRPPSAVQCDNCNIVIHPDIRRWKNKNTLVPVDIRTAAWLDYGWTQGKGERDYCPACSELREGQRSK